MIKKDIEGVLAILGIEGILDTLICVRRLEWATASEVAEDMNIHVATAVKRLSGLYDIGILDRRVRKGKTRSAQEYTLLSNSFGLDIDLDELAGDTGDGGNSELYVLLLKDMARRFEKFSGRGIGDIISDWGIQEILSDDKVSQEIVIQAIGDIMDLESQEYGELTVKSLAAASLDAIDGSQIINNLPKKYFGEGENNV